MADYRQDRDLGAFILIDRLTNQTAALGVVEPAIATTETTQIAPAAEPSLISRVGARMSAGDALLSVALSSGIYALTGNPWAAGAVLATDVVARPILAEMRDKIRPRHIEPADGNNESGAGI